MEWQRTSLKQSQNKDIRLNNSDKSNFLVCIRICVCVCCIITTISTPIFFFLLLLPLKEMSKKKWKIMKEYISLFFFQSEPSFHTFTPSPSSIFPLLPLFFFLHSLHSKAPSSSFPIFTKNWRKLVVVWTDYCETNTKTV